MRSNIRFGGPAFANAVKSVGSQYASCIAGPNSKPAPLGWSSSKLKIPLHLVGPCSDEHTDIRRCVTHTVRSPKSLMDTSPATKGLGEFITSHSLCRIERLAGFPCINLPEDCAEIFAMGAILRSKRCLRFPNQVNRLERNFFFHLLIVLGGSPD